MSPATLVYDKNRNAVLRSRDVRFLKYNPSNTDDNEEDEPLIHLPTHVTDEDEEMLADESTASEEEFELAEEIESPAAANEEVQEEAVEDLLENSDPGTGTSKSRYPPRNKKLPRYLAENYEISHPSHFNSCSDSVNHDQTCIDYFYKISDIPASYEQAINSHESSEWVCAMEEEVHSLKSMQTFEVVN